MAVSLLDLLMNLLNDPAQKAAFVADPQGFLADCGLSNLSADDIHDAIQLAGDNDSHDWKGDHGHHVPPPPPVHHTPGENPHDVAVKYLNSYITNNYNYTEVDARQTNIDNSVHQDIDASHGGHVFAPVDVTNVNATGDGSVAAGHDINGPVATGDHSVAGDGNIVNNGNDNTQAFGGGAATNLHGASASDGGAVAGGTATGGDHTDSHDTLTNFGSGSVATKGGDAGQTDSHNHIDSHNSADSHNDSHATVASNNDLFSHNDDDHSVSSEATTTDDHHVHVDHNPVDLHI